MKVYTTEELQQFVAEHLASGEGIVLCRGINSSNKTVKKFVRLKSDMNTRMYWRGDEQTLKAGDYLHADPDDIYGVPAENFARCYKIIN